METLELEALSQICFSSRNVGVLFSFSVEKKNYFWNSEHRSKILIFSSNSYYFLNNSRLYFFSKKFRSENKFLSNNWIKLFAFAFFRFSMSGGGWRGGGWRGGRASANIFFSWGTLFKTFFNTEVFGNFIHNNYNNKKVTKIIAAKNNG